MRTHQVIDMDVVAHTRTVRGRIIRAENVDMRDPSKRNLASALDQMRRARRGLSRAPLGIGAGDVEIAQNDMAQMRGARGVFEHPFDHQLRTRIGADRNGRLALRQWLPGIGAVDGRSRGEDEIFQPFLHAHLDQGARRHHIIGIVVQRLFDRFRHDNGAGEMHDRIDTMFLDQPADQRLIANIAVHEMGLFAHQRARAVRKIVEHDHALAAIEQGIGHMAADISGAAGDENAHESFAARP